MKMSTNNLLFKSALIYLTLTNSLQLFACEQKDDIWLEASIAIRKGDIEAFDCYSSLVEINSHDPADIWEKTLLLLAAEHDQVLMISKLLAKGADINFRNTLNKSPLRVAIKGGANDAAAFLILSGAEFDMPDELGRTMLYWAIINDNVDITNLLIERKANKMQIIRYADGDKNLTEIALERGNQTIIRLMKNGEN